MKKLLPFAALAFAFLVVPHAHAQTLEPGKAWAFCKVEINLGGTWYEYYTSIFQTGWSSETNERQFGDYMAKRLNVDRASVDPVKCMEIDGWDYQLTANTRADWIKDDKNGGSVIRGVSWPE